MYTLAHELQSDQVSRWPTAVASQMMVMMMVLRLHSSHFLQVDGTDEARAAQDIQAHALSAPAGQSGLSGETSGPPRKGRARQRQRSKSLVDCSETRTLGPTTGSSVKRHIPDVQPIFKRATLEEEQEDYDRDVIRNQNIDRSAKHAVQQFQRALEKPRSVRHYTFQCTSICVIS